MSQRILLAVVAAILATTFLIARSQMGTPQSAPAFPGAEGYARYTTSGGRGGEVYHVTTLADHGPGSFRDAVSQGNRTVVFDVSGYIDLDSNIYIMADNLTIAGQTAPGNGITFRYYTIMVSANNFIMRFIRLRRSQLRNVNDGADAIWGRRKSNIILDHCSFSWSIDEIASFYDNRDFTMQWCLMGEALANPGHSKGEHSFGGIWGGKGASFHHNMLTNMHNRSPRFNGARYNFKENLDSSRYENCLQAEHVDFRNCVIYNWGKGGCYGGPGGGTINIVNNYYKAGPGTYNKVCVTSVMVAHSKNSGKDSTYFGYASRYYVNGNYVTHALNPVNYDWYGVIYENGLSYINDEYYIPDVKHYHGKNVQYVKDERGRDCVRLRLDEPVEYGEVTTHKAEVAFEKVLAYGGASLWRDDVDKRYVEEARTGTVTYTGVRSRTAGIVDSVNAIGAFPSRTCPSFPELVTEWRPSDFDTDGDGMPDQWESANNLDPKNPHDGKLYTIDRKGWYTNLEVYMNSIVEDIMRKGNADAISPVKEYYPKCKKAKK